MDFGNISKEALKLVVEDSYERGNLTLKQRLEDIGEDIEFAIWSIKSKKFESFKAWTKNYVIWYEGCGPFDGIQCIDRNPPRKTDNNSIVEVMV